MPVAGSAVTLSQNRAYSVNCTRLAVYFFLGLMLCQGVFRHGVGGGTSHRGSASFCVVPSLIAARVLFLWRHLSFSVCDGSQTGRVASHNIRTCRYSVV